MKAKIASSYKQTRREDDLNQPLSVQPWGSDSDKHRYYLIEGLDDTHFRVFREGNYTGLKRSWWSVAGDIDELKGLAEKLSKDGGQKGKLLSTRITAAIPRFESTEDVSSSTNSCLKLTNNYLEAQASRVSPDPKTSVQAK